MEAACIFCILYRAVLSNIVYVVVMSCLSLYHSRDEDIPKEGVHGYQASMFTLRMCSQSCTPLTTRLWCRTPGGVQYRYCKSFQTVQL